MQHGYDFSKHPDSTVNNIEYNPDGSVTFAVPQVTRAVLDNTILDSALAVDLGYYIVPSTGTLAGAFVGQGGKYAVGSASTSFTFTSPASGDTVSIANGSNANQKWKFTTSWAQVVEASQPIGAWALAGAYAVNTLVRYADGNVYVSNGAIPANTPFAIGVTGATWSLPNQSAAVCVAKRAVTAQSIPFNVNTKIGFDTFVNSIPGLVLADGNTSLHNTTSANMWVDFSFGIFIPPPDGNVSWQQCYISIQTGNLASEVNTSTVRIGTYSYQSINFGQKISIPAGHKLIVYYMHQFSGGVARNTGTDSTKAPTLTLTYLGK